MPNKRRILFVDDEQNVLDGLRDMLRRERKKWAMSFSASPAQALDLLTQEKFDVIVTDMRMPQIDGAELLTKVKELYPHMVRIILSGQAGVDMLLRATPVAHQMLSKPTRPEILRTTIERACSLQQMLDNEKIRNVIGRIPTLPTLPQTYDRVNRMLSDPEVALNQVADLVSKDAAMAVRVLQIANSAFFGASESVTSIHKAVSYLGVNLLKGILLGLEVFKEFEDLQRVGISTDALQEHATRTAQMAVDVLKRAGVGTPSDHEHALTAGLLHDIGTLVLAKHMPAPFRKAVKLAQKENIDLHVAEDEVFGVCHAEIGAYVLGLWGLPYPIVEAVAYHHHPSKLEIATQLDIVGAVHIADLLCEDPFGAHHMDEDYIAQLGLAPLISSLQAA